MPGLRSLLVLLPPHGDAMSDVDKLIGKLTEAIQKAGGEAARIWPDMVASHALSSWLIVGLGLVIALGSLIVAVVGLRLWRRLDESRYNDARELSAVFALIFGAAGLVLGAWFVVDFL